MRNSFVQFMDSDCHCEFCGAMVPAVTLGSKSGKYHQQVGRCPCEQGRHAWEKANGKGVTAWEIKFALRDSGLLVGFTASSGSIVTAENFDDVVFFEGQSAQVTAKSSFFVTSLSKMTLDDIEDQINFLIIGQQRYIFVVTDVEKAKEVIKNLFVKLA